MDSTPGPGNSRVGMEAAREPRGFEPVRQKVQFDGSEAKSGFAMEREFVGARLIDYCFRRTEARDQYAQPIQAGGIRSHLRRASNLASGLKQSEARGEQLPGQFPIIINKVGMLDEIYWRGQRRIRF
jgi:hypothetical protein